MRLVTAQRQSKTLKYLLRGDSEGVVVLWTVPEVTNQQLTQICQNDRAPPLSLPPAVKTSLTAAWEDMKPPPVGILDQLDSGDGHGIKLTASIYLPQQSRLVVGREDGSIIIVPATQTVMLQLLHGNHQQYDGTIHFSFVLTIHYMKVSKKNIYTTHTSFSLFYYVVYRLASASSALGPFRSCKLPSVSAWSSATLRSGTPCFWFRRFCRVLMGPLCRHADSQVLCSCG